VHARPWHLRHVLRGPRRQSSLPVNRRAASAALAALLGLTVLAAGCGGSNIPGPAGPGPNKTNRTSTLAQGLAYAQCMRGHGVANFPDPSAPPGGGVAFQVHVGPNSDLSSGNPTFQTANKACASLQPTGPMSAVPGHGP
jgi:hypothetical protein